MKAGDRTRQRMLEAGLNMWPDVTAKAVADAVGLTHPAVLYHFADNTLKEAVARYAVETGCSAVIVQLMAMKHPAANRLTAADRIRHFNAI